MWAGEKVKRGLPSPFQTPTDGVSHCWIRLYLSDKTRNCYSNIIGKARWLEKPKYFSVNSVKVGIALIGVRPVCNNRFILYEP